MINDLVRCYNSSNVLQCLSTGGLLNGFARFYCLLLVVSHSYSSSSSSCCLLPFFRFFYVEACGLESGGSEENTAGDSGSLVRKITNTAISTIFSCLPGGARFYFLLPAFRFVKKIYQYCMASLNRAASSFSPAGRADNFVTRCCGRVPSTSLGMSASLKPTALSPLGILNRLK